MVEEGGEVRIWGLEVFGERTKWPLPGSGQLEGVRQLVFGAVVRVALVWWPQHVRLMRRLLTPKRMMLFVSCRVSHTTSTRPTLPTPTDTGNRKCGAEHT